MPDFKAMKDLGKKQLSSQNINLSEDIEVSHYHDEDNQMVYQHCEEKSQYRFTNDRAVFPDFRPLPTTLTLDVFNTSEVKLVLELESEDETRLNETSDGETIELSMRVVDGKRAPDNIKDIHLPIHLEPLTKWGMVHRFEYASEIPQDRYVKVNKMLNFTVSIQIDGASPFIKV